MGHIQWRKQMMKVNLAAQVITASLADALEYCDVEVHHSSQRMLPQLGFCAVSMLHLTCSTREIHVALGSGLRCV